MKTNNKKKIVVSVLALAMGAGLAGSISGSVAWYQYSTKTSANFVGTSAGTSRNLKISKNGGTDWADHVTITNTEMNPNFTFKPASVYIDTNNKLQFVEHPVYKSPILPGVTNASEGYCAEFSLVFKCVDNDSGTQSQKARDVYLSYFKIVNKGTKDITSAVRVYIQGRDGNFIISNSGAETATNGNLDLNNNGKLDRAGYDANDEYNASGSIAAQDQDYILYRNHEALGSNANYGTSYDPYAPSEIAIVDSGIIDNVEYSAFSFGNKDGHVLTTTKTGDNVPSNEVKFTVWIEGWQQLGGSSLWDETWFAQNFELQLQFACEAER